MTPINITGPCPVSFTIPFPSPRLSNNELFFWVPSDLSAYRADHLMDAWAWLVFFSAHGPPFLGFRPFNFLARAKNFLLRPFEHSGHQDLIGPTSPSPTAFFVKKCDLQREKGLFPNLISFPLSLTNLSFPRKRGIALFAHFSLNSFSGFLKVRFFDRYPGDFYAFS